MRQCVKVNISGARDIGKVETGKRQGSPSLGKIEPFS